MLPSLPDLGLLDTAGGREESVAATVHGFDVPRMLWIVAERGPQPVDAHLEDGIARVDAGPHAFKEVLLGQEPPWILGEAPEHGEGSRTQRQRLLVAPQLLVRGV